VKLSIRKLQIDPYTQENHVQYDMLDESKKEILVRAERVEFEELVERVGGERDHVTMWSLNAVVTACKQVETQIHRTDSHVVILPSIWLDPSCNNHTRRGRDR
jgi:hypothetical protein